MVAYLGLDIDLGEFSGKNDKQILEIAKKAHERNFIAKNNSSGKG